MPAKIGTSPCYVKITYLDFYLGMRRDINILIYLDVKKALEGIFLYDFAISFFEIKMGVKTLNFKCP